MTIEFDADVDLGELTAIVRRVLSARTADQHLVEDLVQETLLRVATARRQLDPSAVRAYAIVTARNLLINDGRKRSTARRHAHRLVEFTGFDGPEQASLARDETDALATALDRLDKADRRLLLDHEIDDQSLAKLAVEAGATPGAIGMRLNRARAALRLEFVLAFRHATLPTRECRGVLMALSAGDKRRQRALRSTEHLMQCETCSELSRPLVERRRGAAAWILFPFMTLRGVARRLRTSRTAQVVTACMVAAVVATVWIAAAHSRTGTSASGGTTIAVATSTGVVSPASRAAVTTATSDPTATLTNLGPPVASGAAIAAGQIVTIPAGGGTAAGRAVSAGSPSVGSSQTVSDSTSQTSVASPVGSGVPAQCPDATLSAGDAGCAAGATAVVTDVSANEGFWVLTDRGQDVWIHLVGAGESPEHIRLGDTITCTGTVQPVGAATDSGIPAAQSSRLDALGFFLDVPFADLQITHAPGS